MREHLTDAVGALPDAVNPLALSLNENPFPPLPGVRSALIESIDAANRYPEFLPERLRSLIAGHVGVREEQVVIGVGATGVIMQVLRAMTSPGDRMVMTSPTFDGYPIFAQMARLRSVTVALDQHGHHDLDAMAEAALPGKGRGGLPAAQSDGHRGTGRRYRTVPATSSVGHGGAAGRGVCRVPAARTSHRRAGTRRAVPQCRRAAHVLEGIRPCGSTDRLRVLCARPGQKAVDDAAAVRHRHHRPGGGRGVIRRGKPAAATDSDDRLGAAVSANAAAVDGGLQHRRACQLRLSAGGRSALAEVFDGTGLQVRHYADGSVRITIGTRDSTRAVLAALEPFASR